MQSALARNCVPGGCGGGEGCAGGGGDGGRGDSGGATGGGIAGGPGGSGRLATLRTKSNKGVPVISSSTTQIPIPNTVESCSGSGFLITFVCSKAVLSAIARSTG